jgi:hypothetical protein
MLAVAVVETDSVVLADSDHEGGMEADSINEGVTLTASDHVSQPLSETDDE